MSYRAPLGQTSLTTSRETPPPQGQIRAGTPTSQADCVGGFVFRPARGTQPATCDVCPVSGATLPCGSGTISNPVRDACGYASPPCIIDPNRRSVLATPPVMAYQPSASDTLRRAAPYLAIGAGAGAILGAVGAAQSSQGRALVAGGATGAGIVALGMWFVSGISFRG